VDDGFLGTGWALPPARDGGNRVVLASGDDNVRQSIWTILSTSPGERVMRPTFGSGLHDLVFRPNGPGLAGAAVSAVRQALARWEPRIEVLDVLAFTHPSSPTVLHIDVSYQITATNSRDNLVYPLYLEGT
jgi:phage baseplate assembly protein W